MLHHVQGKVVVDCSIERRGQSDQEDDHRSREGEGLGAADQAVGAGESPQPAHADGVGESGEDHRGGRETLKHGRWR